MMFALVFALVTVAMAVVAAGEETYTNRWDNVDLERILKNERLLRTYFRCVMDQGKCSPDAAELKKNIPEALGNQCAKCSEKQKASVDKVMRHLYEKRQDLFSQVEKKYDPEGTYRQKYKGGAVAGKAADEVKVAEAGKSAEEVKVAEAGKAAEKVKAAEEMKVAEEAKVAEAGKAAEEVKAVGTVKS